MQHSTVKISGRKVSDSGQRKQKRQVGGLLGMAKVVEAIDAR